MPLYLPYPELTSPAPLGRRIALFCNEALTNEGFKWDKDKGSSCPGPAM